MIEFEKAFRMTRRCWIS